MIFKLINSFINEKFDSLRGNFSDKINIIQANTHLDLQKISAGESNITWQSYIADIESDSTESKMTRNVKVILSFKFMIVNKNPEVYHNIFDRYIYGLYRILINQQSYFNENISSSLYIKGLKELNISNADRFDKEYYLPEINFILKITDNNKNEIIKTESITI